MQERVRHDGIRRHPARTPDGPRRLEEAHEALVVDGEDRLDAVLDGRFKIEGPVCVEDGADGLNALTHLEGVYPAAGSYLELGVVKLMLGRVDDSHGRG